MLFRDALKQLGEERLADSRLGIALADRANIYLPVESRTNSWVMTGNELLNYIDKQSPSVRVLFNHLEISPLGLEDSIHITVDEGEMVAHPTEEVLDEIQIQERRLQGVISKLATGVLILCLVMVLLYLAFSFISEGVMTDRLWVSRDEDVRLSQSKK